MARNNTSISPTTKVGDLLESYPELEDTLINMSSAFAKLKNPVLRKTVAKVATLQQVAKVGNLPLPKLINDLRAAAGIDEEYYCEDDAVRQTTRPTWVDQATRVITFDVRDLIDSGEQPIGPVFDKLNNLQDDELLLLIAPFRPEPLIDKAREKGYVSWSEQEGQIVKTWFKPKK